MDNLKRQLKELRAIEPDRGFAARSRAAILATKQKAPFGLLLPSFTTPRPALIVAGAGVFAALMIAIFTLAHPFSSPPTPALSALENTQALTHEFNSMNINIQLKDISYQTSANQTITAAISEIANTNTNHLSPSTLQSEQKNIEPTGNTNPEIDKLLNTIIL